MLHRDPGTALAMLAFSGLQYPGLTFSMDANVKLYISIYQARWYPRLYWCAAKVYLRYFYRPWCLSPSVEFHPSISPARCRSRTLEAARRSIYQQLLLLSHSLLFSSVYMLDCIWFAVRASKIMALSSQWSVYTLLDPSLSNLKSGVLHRVDHSYRISYVYHTV